MEHLENLTTLAETFEQSIEKIAKKKEKKTLNPKAKVRNRGDVCFPANSKHNKSSKDRFPINNINQARNALARAGQYDSAPPWFVGSLAELKNIISKKVYSKYPSIDKEKKTKKSELEVALAKKAGVSEALSFIEKYQSTTEALKDIARAQFALVGIDPNLPEAERNDDYYTAKELHDNIMNFANEFHHIEVETF